MQGSLTRHLAQRNKNSSTLPGSHSKESSRQLLNFAAFAFGARRQELFVFGKAEDQGEPLVALFAQILIDRHRVSPPVFL
jgi:hypothetical protein